MDDTRYSKLGIGRKIQLSDPQKRILQQRAVDNRRQCDCPGGTLCPTGCSGFKDGCKCDEDTDSLRIARGMEPSERGIILATDPESEFPF